MRANPAIETTVKIPAALRDCTRGASDIAVVASDVGEALQQVSSEHPVLRRHLYDERGDLRSFVNIFVNADEIRQLDGLATKLKPSDTVLIVPSIAGG